MVRQRQHHQHVESWPCYDRRLVVQTDRPLGRDRPHRQRNTLTVVSPSRDRFAEIGLRADDFVLRSGLEHVIQITGHGIEASITAFQAKYLLRVFLRQFRDPAQALEELNAQMAALDRGEELISLCVVVFDTEAGNLRFSSAGHPPVWLWH